MELLLLVEEQVVPFEVMKVLVMRLERVDPSEQELMDLKRMIRFAEQQ